MSGKPNRTNPESKETKKSYQKPQLKKYKALRKVIAATAIGITKI